MITKSLNLKYTILLLFLLNFITGLFLLNEGLFYPDSVNLAQAVEKTYQTHMLQPAFKGRYGSVIINLILYLPFYISGQNADFTVRLSGILFHSLSIVVLFLFIKELFNNYNQAFFASLLLSFTPFYLSPNTYGKEHSTSIFFLLFSFYLLYYGLNKKSLMLIGISSFLLGFTVSIKESIIVAVPLFFMLYLNPQVSLRPFKINFLEYTFNPKYILSASLPFLAVFLTLFAAYFKYEIYRALFIKNDASTYFLGLFSPVFSSVLEDLYLSMPGLLFVFFVIGIVRMAFEKSLFFASFFIAWFLLIFYFGNTSSYCARYLDVPIIPVYVFASYALSGLYKKDKAIAFVLLVYFVLRMLVFVYPLLEFRHRYNGQKRFALYVKEKTEPDAIIITMDDSPFIEYYGARKTINHPVDGAQELNGFIDTISKYLKNNIPVYLTESGLSYDRGGKIKEALFKNFNPKIIGEKLTEDYHRPDLKFQIYLEKLFKVNPKNP